MMSAPQYVDIRWTVFSLLKEFFKTSAPSGSIFPYTPMGQGGLNAQSLGNLSPSLNATFPNLSLSGLENTSAVKTVGDFAGFVTDQLIDTSLQKLQNIVGPGTPILPSTLIGPEGIAIPDYAVLNFDFQNLSLGPATVYPGIITVGLLVCFLVENFLPAPPSP